MKTRILHILDSLDMGGIEVFLMQIYRNIDLNSFQFDFLIFKQYGCFLDEVKKLGGKIFICNKNNYLEQIIYISSIIKEGNYQIAHCHNCSRRGLIKELVGAKLGNNCKVISHSHNTGNCSNNALGKIKEYFFKEIISHNADEFLACSKDAAASKYNAEIMKKNRYKIINNGINSREFQFDSEKREIIRKELGLINNELLIGNVGSLETQKNQLFLLDIFYEYLKKNEKSKLIIIGNGSLQNAIREKIHALGIDDSVLLVGSVFNVNDYLNAMDIFVFPSLFEGLGISLVEAQCNGLKCLVSDTLPEEVFLTELVHKQSLKCSATDWSNEIATISDELILNRKLFAQEISNRGYTIESAVNQISEIYYMLAKENL